MKTNLLSWVIAFCICLAADVAWIGPALFNDQVRAPADILIGRSPWREDHPGPRVQPANTLVYDWVGVVQPYRRLVESRWRDGEVPLWNDQSGCGQPLLANTSCEALSPYLPLGFLFGDQHPDAKQLVQMLIAQLFCLLVAARLRLHALAGLTIALAFSFASYQQVWVMHPHVGVAAFAPGLLWALLGLRRRFSLGSLVTAALCVAAMLLAGHVESAFFGVLGASLLAFLMGGDFFGRRHQFIASAGAAGILGLAIAAAQVLPFLSYLEQSDIGQARQLKHEIGGVERTLPGDHLVTLLEAEALGGTTNWKGKGNLAESGFHVGRLVLALAFAGLLCGLLRRERRSAALSCLATAAIAILIGYGPETFADFLAHLPPFDRIPLHRAWMMAQLPLALAAGYCIHALVSDEFRGRSGKVACGLLAVAVLAVTLAAASSILTLQLATPAILAAVPAALALGLIFSGGRKLRSGLATLLVIGIAVEGIMVWRDYIPTVPVAYSHPPSRALQTIAESDKPGRFLSIAHLDAPNAAVPYGVSGLRAYDGIHLRSMFRPWLAMRPMANPSGTQSVTSFPPAFLDATSTRWILSPWPVERTPAPQPPFVATAESPLEISFPSAVDSPLEFIVLRPAGSIGAGEVRFELESPGLPTLSLDVGGKTQVVEGPFGKIERVQDRAMRHLMSKLFAPTRDRFIRFIPAADGIKIKARLALTADSQPIAIRQVVRAALGPTKPVADFKTTFLAERTGVMPRAYLAPTPTPVDSLENAARAVAKVGFDPRQTTILHAARHELPDEIPGGDFVALKLREPRPEKIEIRVATEEPRLLVLADTYADGWRASIGDEELPIYGANAFARAVIVPPGNHRVLFEYRPRAWSLGLLISGLAGLLTLVLTILALSTSRRN